MLKQARFPIRGEAISIKRINMICADVLDIPIAGNFDLIYSIGVFGEHVPWDLRICNGLFDRLKPGGKLFFTCVDVFSKFPYMSKKRRFAESVNLILPLAWKRKLRERLRTFYMTERELRAIFETVGSENMRFANMCPPRDYGRVRTTNAQRQSEVNVLPLAHAFARRFPVGPGRDTYNEDK